jgi:hypothetical protein
MLSVLTMTMRLPGSNQQLQQTGQLFTLLSVELISLYYT